ncbi:unnamed protein product [Acanthoscelides obtectus]|uniref:Rab3 GTPase-activating protein catalytic subunit n=1 Tax=Acanthoscelides obtectus TaxID=200917 RepID=A0A9P0Q4Y9_ACAOB|nr:unnamed protein product [Acanthoscelides obtectus]CAK1652601.1 Rab3 GTPase-activating protein catalytic subunit (Fragments) [Acanthoscelides obtectus]
MVQIFNIYLPNGLASGFPDLRTCLLNQKLQMLNCCIERKLARESSQTQFDSAENSDDEEFFDCSSEKTEEENRKKHSLWNQPVGRLSKFGDMKLLKTGDPLYIPITQEPVLKTEDQLEEDTDVLLKLGSNAEATELRARIMSASLLSDMESFKAANPGSIVEDFIRWYSPRDWIEEEELDEWGQKKGHLSPRMLIEDNNIWVQMWESAKPVPASRQKRLFDDTREAEKILQFLDFRTIGQICQLIMPVLAHCAIYRLAEEAQLVSTELGDAAVKIQSLLRYGERISRDVTFQPRRFKAFIQEVTALELLISQVKSLQYKFNPSGAQNEAISLMVAEMVAGKEVVIENKDTSEVGGRLLAMFTEVQRISNLGATEGGESTQNVVSRSVFPTPAAKEFVLRLNAPKPASYSANCPQFLRAVLTRDDFRLCGAFSSDVAFF